MLLLLALCSVVNRDFFSNCRLKATLERMQRFSESYLELLLSLLPPVAESLGRALGVAPYAIQTFTEAEIRANVVFQVRCTSLTCLFLISLTLCVCPKCGGLLDIHNTLHMLRSALRYSCYCHASFTLLYQPPPKPPFTPALHTCRLASSPRCCCAPAAQQPAAAAGTPW
jgi:hypothetical protein